jgi:Family of unknown function (DUF6399)
VPFHSTPSARPERGELAHLLDACAQAQAQGQSERAFCRQAGIARSTLRDAAEREVFLDAPEGAVAFFTSPEGDALLRRLVFAAHVVLTLLGCGGINLVCTFLRLSGLSAFVASSYGTQHRLNAEIQRQVAAFGQAEQQRLGAAMPAKKIWLCEDETFFPRMLLVALDALSGFLLVERFAERRDAESWDHAVAQGLAGLDVKVIGVTSDLAKGIVRHAQTGLGVAVTPDLFHVEHDLAAASTAALASRVRQRENALDTAHERGTPTAEHAAAFAEAQEQQTRMSAVLEALSDATHPYDVRTGEVRTSADVEADWAEMLDEAQAVADDAALSEASHQGIAKARRASGAIAATIGAFHARVDAELQTLPLPIADAMRGRVLPALYLQAAAQRSRTRDQRMSLRDRARALIAPLQDEASSPMMELSEAAVAALLAQGKQWVALYVRASSCVEGRNGQLSLRHHSLHTLGETKLAALTVMHNFWSQREDGTTAAERFFEQKPRHLFEWLLDVLPDLPWPAQKRPRVAPSPLLN